MLEERNLLSHTYDETRFTNALQRISAQHLPLMQQLKAFLDEKKEVNGENGG